MKKSKLTLLFLLLIFGTSFGFAQNYPYCISGRFAENELFTSFATESDTNVIYGNNLGYLSGVDTLKMDIFRVKYQLDNLVKRPLIVLIHGGDFSTGSKMDMKTYAEQFARKGYVAATIDYRLGWDNTGAAICNGNMATYLFAMYRAVQDVNASLRFLTLNASNYGIDTSYIFLVGQDAGAITALHVGFLNQIEADILFPSAFADMGSLFSATNQINTSYSIKGIFNWCGAILDTSIIDANEQIPILSLHGLKDSIYGVDTGTYRFCYNTLNEYPLFYGPKQIQKRMNHLGICAEANYDANGEHCLFPSLEANSYVPFKMTCFFKNLLCGNCVTQEKNSYAIQTCMDAAPLSNTFAMSGTTITLSPNPTSGSMQVRGYLPSALSISLTLVTMNGMKYKIHERKDLPQGFMNLNIQLPSFLSAGMYILECQLGQEILRQKVELN
jgi:predicted esterase